MWVNERELKIRNKIWRLAKGNHPEGSLLPRWLVVVKAILYPLHYLCSRLGGAQAYQWETDTWIIYGVRYTGEALQALADAQGEKYKITRTGECVTFERLDT